MDNSGQHQLNMTRPTTHSPYWPHLNCGLLGLWLAFIASTAHAEILAPILAPALPLTAPHFLAIASNETTAAKPSAQQKGLLRIYRSNMLKKTYQHIVYPESAINNNHEGEVVLRVTVDRAGKVQRIDYDKRATYNSLNKAAKKALQRAKPFPAVPQRLQGDSFELLMPIRFRLAG